MPASEQQLTLDAPPAAADPRSDRALADTFEQGPRGTIVPATPTMGTTERHALAAVASLQGLTTDASAPSARLIFGETLGQGGMGIVRSGTQTALDRQVAIKTLRADHRAGGETLKLLQEAWVTGSLEHPNIVPIYDLGLDDAGAPVIVLKRIAGIDWSQLMRNGAEVERRFAARDLLEWNLRVLLQVARAIEFAHNRGILHRDIKPENVMVGEFGEVYVLDWGIAVSLRPDESRLPRAVDAVAIAGTPAYMAPEMLGGQTLSPRTDGYLLGATLYEILTGLPPHLGATLAETLENVRRSSPLAPDRGPAELAAVVQKAMAADPAARFAGVAELRAALEAFLEHRSSANLAQEAEESLTALRVEIAASAALAPGAATTHEVRSRVHHLFGECHFGFQAALRSWPENAPAREGLVRATSLVVVHELETGDIQSAAVLLRGLPDPPADLAARVAAAEAAARAEEDRRRAIERRHDPEIGRGKRALSAGVFGVLLSIMPLLIRQPLAGTTPTHLKLALIPLGPLAVLAVLGLWMRRTLLSTVLNRTFLGAGVLSLVGQSVLHLVAREAGIPAAQSEILTFFLWFVVVSMLSVTVERRLGLAAASYLAGFVIAAVHPSWRYYLMTTGNLALTGTMLAIWFRRSATLPAPG
ncbi:MAG: serine/threonine-protein kinase [Byssovorax sp.]